MTQDERREYLIQYLLNEKVLFFTPHSHLALLVQARRPTEQEE